MYVEFGRGVKPLLRELERRLNGRSRDEWRTPSGGETNCEHDDVVRFMQHAMRVPSRQTSASSECAAFVASSRATEQTIARRIAARGGPLR